MINKINPFHELYVTEAFGSDSFVKLFSNVLIDHTAALFKPGNVILKGLPGTGKTMMLSLLKPSIRIAYKRNNIPFPVPAKCNKFIGAGINLIRSSVADFGQRPIKHPSEINELAIYFGDFVNYWIIRDILQSLKELSENLSEEIGIDYSRQKLDYFAASLKEEDCWFGYLTDAISFEDLLQKFKERLILYRSYLHFNIDELPLRITRTKTAIGVPISKTVELLRRFKIIGQDTEVFVRIDQYEELSWLDQSVDGLGSAFKSIINKLLAMRDASVSYRVGTRPFAWSQNSQQIFGTGAKLETSRNYLEISIDDVLRRPESTKTYIFPKFAEDIFYKRLQEAKFIVKGNKNLLREVFGSGLSPSEKASKYLTSNGEKAIVLDPVWPAPWKKFLIDFAKENPLSARFGEAWARQKGKKDIVDNIPDLSEFPWDSEGKKYWKKERTEQALLQIASRNRQQLIWEGRDDILALSGGNILAFLNLCQQIWEVWMRDDSNEVRGEYELPQIDPAVQNLGILQASSSWFEKLSAVNGGKERKQFIAAVGVMFHKLLVEDLSMSYPGHNGFSVENQDLESSTELSKFLKEASDFGDLHDRPHTTKSSDRKKRTKWYLNPILSPYFKIPAIHTKEPLYVSSSEVMKWYVAAIHFREPSTGSSKKLNSNKTAQSQSGQTSLFDE